MRYCRFCRGLSFGNPVYCRRCRRSFNTKVCPAGHPNIRGAVFCEQCGSADLSLPQTRISGIVRILFVLGIALFLVGFFVYLVFFARILITDPGGLLYPMLGGLGLGLLWLLILGVIGASR